MSDSLLDLQPEPRKSMEYGFFNGSKEKICAVNQVSTDDEDWAWLWDTPFALSLDEAEAKERLKNYNAEREDLGTMKDYGPVVMKKREVIHGPWTPCKE